MRFSADFLIFGISAAYNGAILPSQLESGAVWVTGEEKQEPDHQDACKENQSDVSGRLHLFPDSH